MNERICELFETTQLTLQQIADELGVGYKVVWNVVIKHFTLERRKERKVENYRRSKLGAKNPYYQGGYVSEHVRVPRPDWYTAGGSSANALEHDVVLCQLLGLTCVPRGFVVHHVDGDQTNNDPPNLQLMTMADHTRLHWRAYNKRKEASHPPTSEHTDTA